MAGAKLRVKQLVEAAISRNLDESAVKIVYENDNLKNDRQDKCNTELVSQQECECIEHEQDLEPSIFQLSVNHDYISSRNNEPHTSRGIHPVIDPDIIEDSQFEQINTYKLPLRNKKIYTILENATFSDENYEDFSSGSDDVFIPESSANSSTSQSSSEIDVRVSAKDLVVAHPPTSRIQENSVTSQENAESANEHDFDIAPSTSENQENGESQERDIPRKRKIFPPRDNKSKKRSRNERTWKKKAAALAREKGEEYISYKNKVIPKKSIQEGILCHEKCRLQCSTHFAIDERQSILESYYSLDVNSKNALLFNSIVSKPVERQRCNAKTHKSASYKYFVKFAGVTKQVCKLGLCRLYQISRKKVDLVIMAIKSGISAPKPDCRGKHQSRPHKMDEDVVNRIKAHISSFPAEQSHYSRSKNMHKLYLSPLLNVTKMHSLYLEMCDKENLPEKYNIKKSTYSKIFVTEFNLSFGYPKSDTCATCDAGDSNEEHKANYYAAVEAMQVDRKKPTSGEDVLYITVDLQQTMPLPKLTTSKAFYLRQIWFYNLGIHVIDGTSKEKAVCCTWTEDVADRGSSEVASALLSFRDGVKWIRVDEYGSYLYKESYDEMTPFQKVDIFKKRGQVDPNFEVSRVDGKYGTVSIEKKANIKDQLKFVKPEYRYYYESILREE
ncbi:unnamed protein product [Diatraea saccharalis]|uniref:Uncharacterized protein n=1 Tax=Diatraea saccharalis TaxID=40085 RepID=A0A9N9QY39_9NEOP|nr:unnamed protein product [Diatraea saccharalis]